MKLLTPTFKGRGSALGVTIKGDQIGFNKEVSKEIGLRKKEDRLFFGIDENEDPAKHRLYLLNQEQATKSAQEEGMEIGSGWAVTGSPDGRRYVKDQDVVIAAKLVDGHGYTLLRDAKGSFIEFDSNGTPQSFSAKNRGGRTAKPKAVAGAAEEIKARKAEKEKAKSTV